MLDEQVKLCELYDYYQGLLTDKQKDYFQDYYFENLTIQEIADNNDVSKNAVSKTLIEVKEKLEEYESILHLQSNKDKIKGIVPEDIYKKIIEYI